MGRILRSEDGPFLLLKKATVKGFVCDIDHMVDWRAGTIPTLSPAIDPVIDGHDFSNLCWTCLRVTRGRRNLA